TLPPPATPSFPYTPLFRSRMGMRLFHSLDIPFSSQSFAAARTAVATALTAATARPSRRTGRGHGVLLFQHHRLRCRMDARAAARSEEHTSELQSRGHLVCR